MSDVARVLDWAPCHDERSRDYAVRAAIEPVKHSRRLWPAGDVLDQGAEGACVGMACAGEVAAEPVSVPGVTTAVAAAWYRECQRLDNIPDTACGTSVLAGMKVGRLFGMWAGYRWAFDIEDVTQAILQLGPVIIGIPWHAGMYQAPGGVLTVTGDHVGGHAVLVRGYDPAAPELDGRAGFLVRNSWGADWGTGGDAWIASDDLAALLARDGEAVIPLSRMAGRLPGVKVVRAERQAAVSALLAGPQHTTTITIPAGELLPGDRLLDSPLGASVTVQSGGTFIRRGEPTVRVFTRRGTWDVAAGRPVRVRRPVHELPED